MTRARGASNRSGTNITTGSPGGMTKQRYHNIARAKPIEPVNRKARRARKAQERRQGATA